MKELPDDVTARIARGMGAFIRATPEAELPPKLKRFKRFDRPQALVAQKAALVAALDSDELVRGRIAEWLNDGKPALDKKDVELLRAVAERPEGWEESVAEPTPSKRAQSPPAATQKDHERVLAREKERTAKAKEELRRAREEQRDSVRGERARSAELSASLDAARAEITALAARVKEAERAAATAERAAQRAERKSRSAFDRATAKERALREELRAARRELKQLRDAADKAQRAPARRARPPASARAAGDGTPRRRPRLPAPKGRLATDPETLDEWLDADRVRLLVDGYNVTKAEGGFGDVTLAQQRRRLIEGVGKLARRKKIAATIVFDGSEVPPGTSRRPRAPVDVEYSKPGEIADDHLVARLESFDPVPVVVATNDKELQHRAAALGATIATSNQLLALIR